LQKKHFTPSHVSSTCTNDIPLSFGNDSLYAGHFRYLFQVTFDHFSSERLFFGAAWALVEISLSLKPNHHYLVKTSLACSRPNLALLILVNSYPVK